MADVESFTLDHTAVKAPYVRLINVEHGPKGDAISNFDVRFVQPNAGEIPTAGLHTIEHLLASVVRDRIDGLIDISPFGCRTGFHEIFHVCTVLAFLSHWTAALLISLQPLSPSLGVH